MINLLRSDFYKLFRTKSFYVCGLLAAILAVSGVVLLNSAINSELGISASWLGYDAVYALTTGTGQASLFVTIMISIFIPSEFALGTIKNIVSRGISRTSMYLSKFIVGVFIAMSYALLCAGVSFAAGSIMWGTGDLTRDVYLDMFKMLGLFLVAEIAMQSIFIMVGFLVRQTGGTVATNLAITIAFPSLIIPILDFVVKKQQWFKLAEDFDIFAYWPASYVSRYLSMDIAQNDIKVGLIVCGSFIALSLLIGIWSFGRRDVK